MKTMAISQFKSQALNILNQLAQGQDSLVITKRGKPLVRIVPFQENPPSFQPGQLANTLVFEKDIITPLGEEMWESCK